MKITRPSQPPEVRMPAPDTPLLRRMKELLAKLRASNAKIRRDRG
jgi:hypothetical protein